MVFILAILALLVACAPRPQAPSQPVMQPPAPMPAPEPTVAPVPEPLPTVQPPVQETKVAEAKTVNVEIKDFSFQPASLKIKVGDTVVWTQRDSVKHTVTVVSGPETFDSGLLSAGETFSHTFTKPGTYEYKCTPHPGMRGKVVVE